MMGVINCSQPTLNAALVNHDEYRSQVARELHDGIGQELQALRMKAQLIGTGLLTPTSAQQFAHNLEKIIDELRRVSYELHPVILDILPCGQAIKALLQEQKNVLPFKINCNIRLDKRLSAEAERHLFRIFQESLNNSTRHSQASTFKISLLEKGPYVTMEISDDGLGFSVHRNNKGLGIRTIRERARALGGKCQIISVSGRGTKIRINIPSRTAS